MSITVCCNSTFFTCSQSCAISTLIQWTMITTLILEDCLLTRRRNTTRHDKLETKTVFHTTATRPCTNTTYTRRTHDEHTTYTRRTLLLSRLSNIILKSFLLFHRHHNIGHDCSFDLRCKIKTNTKIHKITYYNKYVRDRLENNSCGHNEYPSRFTHHSFLMFH